MGMVARRHISWLEGEIAEWVTQGLVSQDVAERLRERYPERPRVSALPVLGVLGALLIGFGIILLLAHNWAALERSERAALSLGLLVAAQALVLWSLWRRRRSVAWLEGVGAFLACSVAASIALIHQTYQIQGSLRGYLFACVLLIVPLAYVLDSRLCAGLAVIASGGWLLTSLFDSQSTVAYWLLIGSLAPYGAWLYRSRATGPRASFLGWLFGLALLWGAGFDASPHIVGWMLLLVATMAGGLYSASVLETGDESFLRTPMQWWGAIVITVGIVAWSISGLWEVADEDVRRSLHWLETLPGIAVGVVAAALCLWAIVTLARRRDWARMGVASFPIVFTVCLFGALGFETVLGAMVMSLYGLVVGILTIRGGLEELSLVRVNGGILIVAGVVLVRFLDWDLSFLLRGVAFIILGLVMLWLNVRLKTLRERAA